MITGEFDEEILQDLINEGYEGNALLEKFKEIRWKVPSAIEKMLNDLIEQSGGKFYTIKEVFGDEWNNFGDLMKIYLDNCYYNLPFDDQTQKRIFNETNAIFNIINSIFFILGSDVLILEISKIKNIQKQLQVLTFYSQIVKKNINLTEEIENLAKSIVNQSKIHNLYALHLASAIICDAKIFFTTDDKLIKSYEKLNLKISVMNPINFGGDFDEKN